MHEEAARLDPRTRVQRIVDGVLAAMAPTVAARRLAHADLVVSGRRRGQADAQNGQPDDHMLSGYEERVDLFRRVHAVALVLVVSAVGLAFGLRVLLPPLSRRVESVLALASVVAFAWATLARLGWAAQTIKGDSAVERIDEVWFRILYWLGTLLAGTALF